jgi:hypothetical protein
MFWRTTLSSGFKVRVIKNASHGANRAITKLKSQFEKVSQAMLYDEIDAGSPHNPFLRSSAGGEFKSPSDI